MVVEMDKEVFVEECRVIAESNELSFVVDKKTVLLRGKQNAEGVALGEADGTVLKVSPADYTISLANTGDATVSLVQTFTRSGLTVHTNEGKGFSLSGAQPSEMLEILKQAFSTAKTRMRIPR